MQKECKNLEPWGFRLWVYRYWVHNAEEETFLQLGNEKFGEDWALTGTTTCRAMVS